MEIRIHNYDWKVEYVEADAEKMNPDSEKYNAGLTEYAEQVISIRKGMSWSRTRATVIHELVHAFIDSYGYTADCMTEEEMCEFFGAQGDDIICLANRIMGEVCSGADDGRD